MIYFRNSRFDLKSHSVTKLSDKKSLIYDSLCNKYRFLPYIAVAPIILNIDDKQWLWSWFDIIYSLINCFIILWICYWYQRSVSWLLTWWFIFQNAHHYPLIFPVIVDLHILYQLLQFRTRYEYFHYFRCLFRPQVFVQYFHPLVYMNLTSTNRNFSNISMCPYFQ